MGLEVGEWLWTGLNGSPVILSLEVGPLALRGVMGLVLEQVFLLAELKSSG